MANIFNPVNIVNAVTSAVNKVYTANLPAVNKQNFSDFGKQLAAAPDQVRNAWISTLVNLVGVQKMMNDRAYESPFRALRGDELRAFDLQLLAMDLLNVKNYSPLNDAGDFFEDEPVHIEAQYIQNPVKQKIPVSVVEDELYGALTTEGAFMKYVNGITRVQYNTSEMTDVLNVKTLIKSALDQGLIRLETGTRPVDQATALAFSKKLKVIANDLKSEMTPDFNLSHMYTFTGEGDGVLITDVESMATLDTYVKAWAFHQDFADYFANGRSLTVKDGSFGDVFSLYVDREFFQIHDIIGFPKMTEQYFGNTLQMKRWLHIWRLYAISLFSNAVAFVPAASIGTGYTFTLGTFDGATAYDRGADGKIVVATMTGGTGAFDRFGTYAITGATDSDTEIDPATGRFHIGSRETGDSNNEITVTWTSHLDANKTATLKIGVNQ